MTEYAVVTFGTPGGGPIRRTYRSEAAAVRAARTAMGTGSCSCARVLACSSVAQAMT